jgi:hypothetical protein
MDIDTIALVGNSILEKAPKIHRTGRKKAPPIIHVKYTVDWDISAFLDEQCYDEPGPDAFPKAVTLTG